MFFFENYPKVNYVVNGDVVMNVTDITKRFKFTEEVLKNKYVLFNYVIKEGERPDIIAHKYYKDSRLDWVILLTNKIIDPYFGWPLSNREFEDYIVKKYGSLEYAKKTYSRYFKIVQPKTKTFDGFIVPERTVEIDFQAYTNTPVSDRKRLTIYQDEYNKNEKKKTIKIIEKSYIGQIQEEFKKLYE